MNEDAIICAKRIGEGVQVFYGPNNASFMRLDFYEECGSEDRLAAVQWKTENFTRLFVQPIVIHQELNCIQVRMQAHTVENQVWDQLYAKAAAYFHEHVQPAG